MGPQFLPKPNFILLHWKNRISPYFLSTKKKLREPYYSYALFSKKAYIEFSFYLFSLN